MNSAQYFNSIIYVDGFSRERTQQRIRNLIQFVRQTSYQRNPKFSGALFTLANLAAILWHFRLLTNANERIVTNAAMHKCSYLNNHNLFTRSHPQKRRKNLENCQLNRP